MILELQRADRMCDAFDRILNWVSEVVHRVNAPLVSGILMRQMRHAVDDRIPHVDVGRCHINLCAKRLLAVCKLSFLHLRKELQVLLNGAFPHRIILARLRERSAILAHFIRRKVRHIGLSLANQLQCDLIHFVEVVAGEEETILIIRAQPLYIFLDRLHELRLFFRRVRIIKAKIELAAVFLRKAIVQKNTLGMTDVKIAVRLRRETGLNMIIPSLRQILVNLQLNKILILSVEGIHLYGSVLGALHFIRAHISLSLQHYIWVSENYFSFTL